MSRRIAEPNKIKVVGQYKNRLWVATKCRKDIAGYNDLPRFIHITGPENSGKFHFAKYIASYIEDSVVVVPDQNAEEIRQAIQRNKNAAKNVVIIIPNVHTLNNNCTSALLKITECFTKHVWIIITSVPSVYTQDNPLYSRATEIKMEPYSHDTLSKLCTDSETLSLAKSPSEIKIVEKYGARNLINFAESVIDDLPEMSYGKTLMLDSKFIYPDSKDSEVTEDKIPIHLFFEAAKVVFRERMENTDDILSLKRCTYALSQTVLLDGTRHSYSGKSLAHNWTLGVKEAFTRAKS